MGGAFLCLTIGLRTTPPVTASLVSGIEPVLNPILVALFYGELMGPLSFLGAVIVVGGVVGYNVLLTKHKGKKTPESAGGRQRCRFSCNRGKRCIQGTVRQGENPR